jgi:hypothetical protein
MAGQLNVPIGGGRRSDVTGRLDGFVVAGADGTPEATQIAAYGAQKAQSLLDPAITVRAAVSATELLGARARR